MGVYAKNTTDLLTANGGTDGYATVASNAQYFVGATVWLDSNTQPSRECVVTDLNGATKVGLRIRRFVPNFPDREIVEYNRSDLSAYLTADAASISQVAGVVPNP